MVRTILGAALVVFACHGQSFEVASVKPAPPPEGGRRRVAMDGGPGSPTPGLFTCQNCSLSMLLSQAYALKPYQLPRTTELASERFNIVAKVPRGTTNDQFRIMQQNLLVERFKLRIHYEKKEMPMYELAVGKNGSKLKKSVGEPPPRASSVPPPSPYAAGGPKLDKDGFPLFPAGVPAMMSINGRTRWQAVRQTMQQIANVLSSQVAIPVTDATGLDGKYDFVLSWATDGMGGPMGREETSPPSSETGVPELLATTPAGNAGPTLSDALQQQLGLKLEQKKGPVDVLVIDHIEKVPTAN